MVSMIFHYHFESHRSFLKIQKYGSILKLSYLTKVHKVTMYCTLAQLTVTLEGYNGLKSILKEHLYIYFCTCSVFTKAKNSQLLHDHTFIIQSSEIPLQLNFSTIYY